MPESTAIAAHRRRGTMPWEQNAPAAFIAGRLNLEATEMEKSEVRARLADLDRRIEEMGAYL